MEGRIFHILTDHMPLTHVFTKISDAWSARQCRHIAEISEYTTDVRHISGLKNVVADVLSRVSTVVEGISPQKISDHQQKCDDTQRLHLVDGSSMLKITLVPFNDGRVSLLCDVSTGCNRPIVPYSLRRKVFEVAPGDSCVTSTHRRKVCVERDE